MLKDTVFTSLIKKEQQLLARQENIEILAQLIDDEFIEYSKNACIFDKHEAIRWLESETKSKIIGQGFKAKPLSEDVVLINYISVSSSNNYDNPTKSLRCSVWRKRDNQWRMVYHQGTPIHRE